MIISERMFQIMQEKGITQAELSRLTGISTKTISDWRQKKTNPGADKIMLICQALNIAPETLLVGDEKHDYSDDEDYLISCFRDMPENTKKRLLAYAALLSGLKKK